MPTLPPSALAELIETVRAEALIGIREDALAAIRPDLRRELVATRNEMNAMSHRFVSIEEVLNTISRWHAELSAGFQGVEQHCAELSASLVAELTALRQRIATTERLARSWSAIDGIPRALQGVPLIVTDGPYGRFLVRHPDLIGDAIIRGEFWDPYLKDAIETHANLDLVAIDAGAYIGFHSVFMARHFGRVYAFEPQREAYNLLCANMELNGQKNIEASEVGLYSHSCWLRLAPDELQEIAIPRNHCGIKYESIENAAALAFVSTSEQSEGSVRAITIDSLNLDKVGFIKIDTQGADFCVLRGAEETLHRCRPVVAFEFERDLSAAYGTRWPEIEVFFKELGYSLTEADRTRDGKQADYVAIPAR